MLTCVYVRDAFFFAFQNLGIRDPPPSIFAINANLLSVASVCLSLVPRYRIFPAKTPTLMQMHKPVHMFALPFPLPTGMVVIGHSIADSSIVQSHTDGTTVMAVVLPDDALAT